MKPEEKLHLLWKKGKINLVFCFFFKMFTSLWSSASKFYSKFLGLLTWLRMLTPHNFQGWFCVGRASHQCILGIFLQVPPKTLLKKSHKHFVDKLWTINQRPTTIEPYKYVKKCCVFFLGSILILERDAYFWSVLIYNLNKQEKWNLFFPFLEYFQTS